MQNPTPTAVRLRPSGTPDRCNARWVVAKSHGCVRVEYWFNILFVLVFFVVEHDVARRVHRLFAWERPNENAINDVISRKQVHRIARLIDDNRKAFPVVERHSTERGTNIPYQLERLNLRLNNYIHQIARFHPAAIIRNKFITVLRHLIQRPLINRDAKFALV